MMTLHLVMGVAVVLVTVATVLALIADRPRGQVTALAGWAIALLVMQAATGAFLLTATREGPGPLHIALPLAGLAIAAAARSVRPGFTRRDLPVLGAAFSIAAAAAVAALVTGLASG